MPLLAKDNAGGGRLELFVGAENRRGDGDAEVARAHGGRTHRSQPLRPTDYNLDAPRANGQGGTNHVPCPLPFRQSVSQLDWSITVSAILKHNIRRSAAE